MDREAFVARFGGVFEASPWIAERAYEAGPFDDVDALHAAMVRAVERAPRTARIALIRAHPDLAGRAAIAGTMTDESTREQHGVGLDRLTPGQFERLTAINADYRDKFGFPFVICVRLQPDADAIIAAAAARVRNDPETEERTALAEIAKIARLRLDDLVAPDTPPEGPPP